jgi:transcriptional regulator with XRE-family HTH domain
MGRPEKPIDGDCPVARLGIALRIQRRRAGSPTYAVMGKRVHRAAASLSTAANGRATPTWELVEDYLSALNQPLSPMESHAWRRRWEAAKEEENRQKRAKRQERRQAAAAAEDARVISAYSTRTLPVRVRRLLVDQVDQGQLVLADREPRPIDLERMDSIAAFLAGLRQLRMHRSLSLRELAERIRVMGLPDLGPISVTAQPGIARLKNIPHTALHKTLNGTKMPELPFLFAYLNACGCPPEQIHRWAQTRRRIEHAEAAREALREVHRELSERPSPIPRHLRNPPPPDDQALEPPRPNAAVALSYRPSYRGHHIDPTSARNYRLALATITVFAAVVLAGVVLYIATNL